MGSTWNFPTSNTTASVNHVETYLDNHGWQSVVTPISQLFAENDLPLHGDGLPFADYYY
jgi:hypothetical protein